MTGEHRNTQKNVWDHVRTSTLQRLDQPRRGHARHVHANVNLSVLRRSHENVCVRVCAVWCLTAYGDGGRILQLRRLAISLCRRCLHFRVSATASAVTSRGIYVVGDERVRGVLSLLKGTEGVIRRQGREDARGNSGGAH